MSVQRIARFRRRAGDQYSTSLMAVGEHRPDDSNAIKDWLFTRATANPSCFACRTGLVDRPVGAFLSATPVNDRRTVAGAAMCLACWSALTPEEIEEAALGVLRRQLLPHGDFL